MQLTNFDLFGHPVVVPSTSNPPVRRRVVSEEAKRAKLIRHLEQNNNFLLFEELLDFLIRKQHIHVHLQPVDQLSDCSITYRLGVAGYRIEKHLLHDKLLKCDGDLSPVGKSPVRVENPAGQHRNSGS